ncbi:UPF0231 protein [Thalassotalea insulae]|uniref:UPF0231 protein n=1 Tax=Thalassotalea insulae TaxID=2056778 RepID=A0ABQ6GQ73_9GAMM|nr:YacL family protein [Thalassotalea insulae]GLX77759.1 UPF0231 protein [Thalassotalea insulae]
MEYEFIHDAITGNAKAQFSLEHQIIGPWLETEIGDNTEKLTELLTALEQVSSGKTQELLITGREYSVILSQDDIQVQVNALLNGECQLPEELQSDELQFDALDSSACGIEDFRSILLSWAKFTKG